MSELLKLQFELARQNLWKDIEPSKGDIFDIQPEGFNNTIHWQLGHIYTAAENFLFGQEGQLPASYNALFGYGSKPANWSDDVPSVETLVRQLKDQIDRIKEIPNDRFETKLPEPILGRATYGELVSFTAVHESMHIGQIHIMKKLVETLKK